MGVPETVIEGLPADTVCDPITTKCLVVLGLIIGLGGELAGWAGGLVPGSSGITGFGDGSTIGGALIGRVAGSCGVTGLGDGSMMGVLIG